MHPINSHNFGSSGVEISFYNGSSVVNGYIVKQIGIDTFHVTDGTHTATCSLAPTIAIVDALSSNPTYCTMIVYPYSTATGATFTAHYGVDSTHTTIQAGGASSSAGYADSDVLTLTGTGGAQITVNTVDGGGGILTFTVSDVGTVTALPSNPVPTTGGTGTGATFNLKYKLLSVSSSGGTGYSVGDLLIFNNIVATTLPTADITTATSGAASAVTVNSAGTGISTAATSVGVTGAPLNVVSIYSRKLIAIDSGNNRSEYEWTLGSSVNHSAYIPTY